jgi:hypothetical protein
MKAGQQVHCASDVYRCVLVICVASIKTSVLRWLSDCSTVVGADQRALFLQ